MQKYLIFILSLLFFQSVSAQEELDSGAHKEDSRLKDLNWVRDTCFGAFKTRRFVNLRVVYPSFKTYRRFIDTSEAGSQSSVTQYTMYNTFWNRLRIQHTRLLKKSEKAGVEWDKVLLDSSYADTGGTGGNEFVYMHWVLKQGKRRYLVSALFLKMRNKWFLMDELRFAGLIPDKKKKKKKR